MANYHFPQQIQPVAQTRVGRIMAQYKCDYEDAMRFIDFRDEGYSVYESAVMAGIADPDDSNAD